MANPLREIVIRAWSDAAFKSKLKDNPLEVFQEYGIEVRSRITEIKVVENEGNVAYFVLPEAPTVANLNENDIQKILDTALGEQLILPTIW